MATNQPNPKVYLDVEINNNAAGRITIELFSDVTPKTAENFLKLCKGECVADNEPRTQLYFKGSPFHRVCRGLFCQGGDYQYHNGIGGLSSEGRAIPFENFDKSHDEKGLVSMANGVDSRNNRDPLRNGINSQFFITLAPMTWLDGKHVCFGKVVDGFEVLELIDQVDLIAAPDGEISKPKYPIIISDCGALEE